MITKKQSFHFRHEDFLKLAKLTEIRFNHEIVGRMPTTVKPSLRSFHSEDGELTIKDVKTRAFINMVIAGLIDEIKPWTMSIVPKHHFTPYDEDGYAQSVYTVEVEVYRSEYLLFSELNIK